MCEAIIDLGTNSALLTVGRRAETGVRVLADVCTIVRLGQGVDASGALHEDAKARASACVAGYVEQARALGARRVTLVSTAVLRDARDGAAFLAALVERNTHPDCEVVGELVSGEREAELSFAGALGGLPSTHDEPVVVLDVGGGSSEIVLGEHVRVTTRTSLPVGAVRMTERYVKADPPGAEALADIAAETRRCFLASPFGQGAPLQRPRVVAVAGTATTLAAIDLELAEYDGARVHGHPLTLSRMETLRARLAASPLEARRQVVGLQAGRADVIVAGATILLTLVALLGADSLQISDHGLRHGRLAERLA